MSDVNTKKMAIARKIAEHFDEAEWGVYERDSSNCPECNTWLCAGTKYCSECGHKASIQEQNRLSDETIDLLYRAYTIGRKAAKKYKRENQ